MKSDFWSRQSDLVRYSRAGDAFHYRWAARRCLRMIDPRCPVHSITIESSKNSKLAGECAIDVAEYAESLNGNKSTTYYQLKHSTVRKTKKLGLAELGKTLTAFAQRFSAHTATDEALTFNLVTNRRLDPRLTVVFEAIRQGGVISLARRRQLEKVTRLEGESLQRFISALTVVDGEGDYVVQHEQLHGELAEFIAGFVDSTEVDKIVNLVAERALPHAVKNRRKGEVLREDVLQRLGVTSIRSLFPAPRELESLSHVIKREQHESLLLQILQATAPLIIHAAGGVGKSVVARQIAESLPKGSLGLVYDCFGSGKYRNPSEPRHRACDALIQLANELAAAGYCTTLIGHPGTPSDALFRGFLERLREAIKALREIEPGALLVLLIDAADNAEMAAKENSDQCFAHALLRENLPAGCRLVALCRTERKEMLKPQSTVVQLSLAPFSEKETAAHLRGVFPQASDDDVREFHRLTGGNPRVQANSLSSGQQPIEEILASLGPAVTTVSDQINNQLKGAVARIKDHSTTDVARQIDAICLGLANLPPFIPVAVLARAAEVAESTIKSFVSDLGRPLWHSDNSVQFRDEPAESWFREQFAASAEQIRGYVTLLEPLARDFPYVAKALPQLLLTSANYTRLIELALSDEFLPENNPIDERNIRVYRLQFAFRAALRVNRLADAAQLAFRAGEEVAGDQRQLLLLRQNADLVTPLLDPTRVQELAYRQLLRGAWQGSENSYSASLLSSVEDFKGEARGYLRAAEKWMRIFFEARAKRDKHDPFREQLRDDDIAEMAWAHFNLRGVEPLVCFLLKWKPSAVILRVTRLLVYRLMDAARFAEIDQLALRGRKSVHLTLAVADVLYKVGRFSPAESLRPSLTLLARKGLKKPQDNFYNDIITPSIVSFCEACLSRGLAKSKILSVLEYYTEAHATRSVSSNFQEGGRNVFFRAIALRAVLTGTAEPDPKSLLPPQEPTTQRRYRDESEERNLLQIIGGLLPWHYLRARLLAHDPLAPSTDLEKIRQSAKSALYQRYLTHDPIPYEMSVAWFSVLALKPSVTDRDLEYFTRKVINRAPPQLTLNDRLNALYTACRIKHLAPLRTILEKSCAEAIEPASSESPEARSNSYIHLARAVLAVNATEASAYFVRAIEAVSKFGDEMVVRWEAIVSVARRAAEGQKASDQMAYRFFKCAEMVGDSVAREKHWSRSEVFRVGVQLHASGAFAAMSRWRDREVCWFDRPMLALATAAVKSGQVAALPGWCLSGLLACNGDAEFAACCIRRESSSANRQYILDASIQDLKLKGINDDDLHLLQAVAEELGLDQTRLAQVLATRVPRPTPPQMLPPDSIPHPSEQKERQPADWDAIFCGIDVLTSTGIARAEAAYREKESPFGFDDFWTELVRRVPAGDETKFLDVASFADPIDFHALAYLLVPLRQQWLSKASVRAVWPRFLASIGRRNAVTLSQAGYLEYWMQRESLVESDVLQIKSGMVRGLAESLDFVDAQTFFGFVGNVAPDLTTAEAARLLDYSLSRFEKHIDEDFADGPWADWLVTSSAAEDALAGFLWSALASPVAAMRWQAVHCVRRLVEAGCEREINSLFDWLNRDVVAAFGSHRFPFYRLHARLYLLIALARAACDTPERLERHAPIFAQLALEGIPHILIQKTAAEIALTIENTKPGTYIGATKMALQSVGRSPFPVKEVEAYSEREKSPWHAKETVDQTLKLHFGMDFDHYWFNYLGDVFGVSEQQAIELGREAAVTYLDVANTDDYQRDPRQQLWQSRDYNSRGTSHDHGSYPNIDDYHFYYSYHSLLFLASRLLGAMPVVRRKDGYEEDPWADWLHRHWFTRIDRRWLMDRRDPSPLKRRAWTATSNEVDWIWSVRADDFLDVLLHQSPNAGWLCVGGYWTDCVGDRIERLGVSSAFVTPETANALADSLRWSGNPHDYRLPHYEDDDDCVQFKTAPFELTGWICERNGGDKRLDGFDPHAREIGYPPYEIGTSFAAALGLSPDGENREWRRSTARDALFLSELWSEKPLDDCDKPFRYGARICGSISELTQLCAHLKMDLIFSVEICRRLHEYRGSRTEDFGYIAPSHKVFLLSANGLLRDAHQCYQVG